MKAEIPDHFDHNGPGIKGNLFGLPFTAENANVVIVPVPWEVTVSFRTGTASAPEAILAASHQIDLYDREIHDVWKLGVSMLPISTELFEENNVIRSLANKHYESLYSGVASLDNDILLDKINEACENLNIYVKNTCARLLREGKLVGLLGGDHSSILGLLRALSEKYERFGILQIDAHADLRKSYMGFQYSHGSIMYHALKLPSVGKIVQAGVRDFCDEEMKMMQRAGARVKTFFDSDIKAAHFEGNSWSQQCEHIIKELPDLVYISFDIDGLRPSLCPHTGTPVPGGFELEEVSYLMKQLVKSGKKIIGFDVCEVAPGDDEWDAIVGARVLWILCNWAGVSHKLLSLN